MHGDRRPGEAVVVERAVEARPSPRRRLELLGAPLDTRAPPAPGPPRRRRTRAPVRPARPAAQRPWADVEHVARRRDADRGERGLLLLDRAPRSCWCTNSTRCPAARSAAIGVDRARDRLVGEPHHTVEVAAAPGADRRMSGRIVWPCWHGGANLCGCPASNRSPRSATRHRSRSTTSRRRRTTCSATPTSTPSLARHPRNIVAIDVPRDPTATRTLRASRRNGCRSGRPTARWCATPRPSFTLYRMRFTDEVGTARETVGVIGALEVVDEGAGGVLPHERTTPKAKTDRLDLTRATNANLSPVWGLSLTPGLTELLREPAEPVGTCHDEHGRACTPSSASPTPTRRCHQRLPWRRARCSSPTATTATPSAARTATRCAHAGQRCGRGRAHARLRRRARRRPAQHRRHPPPVPRHVHRRAARGAVRFVRSGGGRTGRRPRSPPRSWHVARCAWCGPTAPACG